MHWHCLLANSSFTPQSAAPWGWNLRLDSSAVAQRPAKEEVLQDEVHDTVWLLFTLGRRLKTRSILSVFSVHLCVKQCQKEAKTTAGRRASSLHKCSDTVWTKEVMHTWGNDTIIADFFFFAALVRVFTPRRIKSDCEQIDTWIFSANLAAEVSELNRSSGPSDQSGSILVKKVINHKSNSQ